MEMQEAPKRKYKKHKKEIKITIKHYINDKVKVLDKYDRERHPLYFQITVKRKTLYYRSKLEIFSDSTEMYLIDQEYGKAMKQEIQNLTHYINYFDPATNPGFSTNSAVLAYRNATNFLSVINSFLVRELTEAIWINNPDYNFEAVLDSDVVLKDVPALILYDKHKHLTGVQQVKARYCDEVWWLPFYYETFCSALHSRRYDRHYVYHILEPTLIDYTKGGLKDEFLLFFIESQDAMNQMFKAVDELIRKYLSTM